MIAGIKPEWLILGAVAGLVLAAMNAKALARAAGEVPVDIFYGLSEGIFGLPDTRTAAAKSACQAARAAGDCWEASFQCPALDYFDCLKGKYL